MYEKLAYCNIQSRGVFPPESVKVIFKVCHASGSVKYWRDKDLVKAVQIILFSTLGQLKSYALP